MKNVPVGKKMLMGFGAVILMVVLILSVSTVTSVTRNNDLSKSTVMSDLLREANAMMDNFNAARIEIRTVFTSVNAEEELKLAAEILAKCDANLDNMEKLSTQLGGYMGEDIKTLRAMFGVVNSSITAVGENDAQARSIINDMIYNGTTMSESMSELSRIVSDLVVEMGKTDTADALNRVETVIKPVNALSDHIEILRIESRNLTLNQDLAVIPTLTSEMDTVVNSVAEIRPLLATDAGRAAIDNTMSAVEGFRESVLGVEKVVKSSDVEIANARQIFDQLSETVMNYVLTIAKDVEVMNDSVVSASRAAMVAIIIVGIFAAVFSVAVALYLSRAITRPLSKMQMIATQVGTTGNLDFPQEVRDDVMIEAEAKDELGQSIKAFTNFVDRMTYMADCLKDVAKRDLSVDVKPLSDKDTMGVAMQSLLDNLNEVFREINDISNQVAASSHEVAIGAQTLAQGSTEQAATVQEISASVTEINEQMNLSNATATSAAGYGVKIGNIANEGNEKMNHMIGSMTDINDASQAIGRVIKVIDDIAFQTNILALNAAVEAARAGHHGKGFAVVADEVRNLAAKSADAAKETANLISTNIEKTEQGLAFTNETAESLRNIIEGIGKTNQSLNEVAEQSENTKMATSQVTSAIEQVSTVIQHNSATSEQSAAASEEMSSQAQLLQEYIARFKLRSQNSTPQIIPSSTASSGDEEYVSTGMALSHRGSDKY